MQKCDLYKKEKGKEKRQNKRTERKQRKKKTGAKMLNSVVETGRSSPPARKCEIVSLTRFFFMLSLKRRNYDSPSAAYVP
jgi:hypothetical protein